MRGSRLHGSIQLAHGDGGVLTAQLVSSLFLRHLKDEQLTRLDDAAQLEVDGSRLAFTTDGFVVNPIFFPGGDIGKLAVCGTVNDLAVSGATPRYLSAAFVLEEGLPLAELEAVVTSMAHAAAEAGVAIVAGDTKVVEAGHGDKLFITTSGIGAIAPHVRLGFDRILPGDLVLVSGGVGEHGIAVLSRRPGIAFETTVVSDCAPINILTTPLLAQFGDGIRFMRDPTRGGLATTVNEIAAGTRLDVVLDEEQIPIMEEVAAAADLLGLDPLYLANEGKFVMVADRNAAPRILEAIRAMPGGEKAAVIGEIRAGTGQAFLRTPLGATRFLDLPVGAQLPRIC